MGLRMLLARLACELVYTYDDVKNKKNGFPVKIITY
jgi:hypothetical protein